MNKGDKISDAELQVMEVVWSRETATSAEICAVLEHSHGWETSTIRTMIRRLMEKGVLLQEKKDVYHYAASVSRREFARERTVDLVQKVYQGSAKDLVAALLESDSITDQDLRELRAFWDKGVR